MYAAKRVWRGKENWNVTSRRFRGLGEWNGCENECQGVTLESSLKAVSILRALRSPSDLGRLHIRDRNNQCHVILQHHACKRLCLEREASCLHNLKNSCFILRKCSRNDLKRPEIQIFPGVFPIPYLWVSYTCIYALLETPTANFCLRSCTHPTHTHTHKHIYTKKIDNTHTHKYTQKHTHTHTHTYSSSPYTFQLGGVQSLPATKFTRVW